MIWLFLLPYVTVAFLLLVSEVISLTGDRLNFSTEQDVVRRIAKI